MDKRENRETKQEKEVNMDEEKANYASEKIIFAQQRMGDALSSVPSDSEAYKLIREALDAHSKMATHLYSKGLLRGLGLTFEEHAKVVRKTRSNPEEIVERLFQRDDFYMIIDLMNGASGLSCKTSEILNVVRKSFFLSEDLDDDKVRDTLSECLWYLSLIITGFRFNFQELMNNNIEQLIKLGRLERIKNEQESLKEPSNDEL